MSDRAGVLHPGSEDRLLVLGVHGRFLGGEEPCAELGGARSQGPHRGQPGTVRHTTGGNHRKVLDGRDHSPHEDLRGHHRGRRMPAGLPADDD